MQVPQVRTSVLILLALLLSVLATITSKSNFLAQKCEKKVVDGENVIVCCDKNGKNCAKT